MYFTVGNLYKGKEAFIDSLSYTIDDNYPWEIKKGMVLPMIVDVAISMTLIESKSTTYNKSKYAYK
jgi:ssRNA-specific RNase YbeY (16S rRNA maturation enzyme)